MQRSAHERQQPGEATTPSPQPRRPRLSHLNQRRHHTDRHRPPGSGNLTPARAPRASHGSVKAFLPWVMFSLLAWNVPQELRRARVEARSRSMQAKEDLRLDDVRRGAE